MGSVVTRIAEIIEPEVFSRYLIQQAVKKTTLYRSGILQVDSRVAAFIEGGSDTFNMPFWKRPTGDVQAIQSNYTITTDKIESAKQIARRLLFAKAWAAEEIAGVLAGEKPMDAITSMVDQFWNEQYQKILFNSIIGIIGDNENHDSADLVYDITTTTTPAAANKMSRSAVANACKLLGDASDFGAIAMHSTPYWNLVDLNVITNVPAAAQDLGFGTFGNMSVIVCDEIGYDTDGSNKIYWNILFRRGAVGYGESGARITPVEIDRNAAKSEDALFTRRQLVMHPYGFAWIEGSVVEQMPTLRELREEGNWNRVEDKKNCGFVVIKSNG